MTRKIELPYKMLIFDIETCLKDFLAFGCGDTYLSHKQLTKRSVHQYNIICICAKWYDSPEILTFTGEHAVEEFDKEARKADVCIGKNNLKFDNKYINTERLMRGLKPYPEWIDTSDDLEQQLRKNFNFTSQSLDYISELFGTGGKEKMEFEDWRSIHDYDLFKDLKKEGSVCSGQCEVLFKKSTRQVIQKGKAALKKMLKYCRKDVKDTEAALIKVLPYIRLKKNASKEGQGCVTCGSTKLVPTKIITKGQTRYQQFDCLEHEGYGGKATLRYGKQRNKIFGKMQS